ncbi:MAG: hypothetical protein M3Y72_20165 [Acidobacteriota bacterium]|nr:hypothetical protein [Acidobacteriota bacterium]
MKRSNNFSSLIGHLSGAKTKSAGSTDMSLPTDWISSRMTQHSAPLLRPGSSHDAKAVSVGAAWKQTGIHFGVAQSSSGATSGATSQWASLLSKTASGGLASAFGGNLLSVVGGLGGLVSGIAGLFGGSKKTLPALVPFQLPNSQSQTVEISQNSSHSESGTAISSDGVYGRTQHTSSVAEKSSQSPNYTYQSQQIAQAVKEALLNSSSLNDVIAEI